ncbi:thioredoxin family protein [bacterium]|nr:thioredoxin family protein [candidate division CSSED10-310 bacterium]
MRVTILLMIVAMWGGMSIIGAGFIPPAAEESSDGAGPKTFEEARALAGAEGRPLLIKFAADDCDYCDRAAREAGQEAFRRALDQVIYLPLNVDHGEGVELARQYDTGALYPVFILADQEGELIYRWTGYLGVEHFVTNLNKALQDPRPLQTRMKEFEAAPTFTLALELARYHTEINEYMTANELYRRAEKLAKVPNVHFSYQIFENTANAAWNDKIGMDQVVAAADEVLAHGASSWDLLRTAKVMIKIARKFNQFDGLATYLKAALDGSAAAASGRLKDERDLLLIDWKLYVDRDESGALQARKQMLGADWETKPDQFYMFAIWCWERKINIEETERFTRQAVSMAKPGKFKAGALHMLAEILEHHGQLKEAVTFMQQAVSEAPGSEYYKIELDRLIQKLAEQK